MPEKNKDSIFQNNKYGIFSIQLHVDSKNLKDLT